MQLGGTTNQDGLVTVAVDVALESQPPVERHGRRQVAARQDGNGLVVRIHVVSCFSRRKNTRLHTGPKTNHKITDPTAKRNQSFSSAVMASLSIYAMSATSSISVMIQAAMERNHSMNS